jgi:hypothetical protein
MGVLQNLIVVEDRLQEIFDYLPEMKVDGNPKSFKVRFEYGDEKELVAFLKATETETSRPYPLIWLVYPHKETHLKTRVKLESVKLVIAVDTAKAMLNPERLKVSYKTILMPLCNNIVKVLTKANIINIEHEFNITKYPNYSGKESGDGKHFTTDIWDAIQLTFSCYINGACLKEIKI